MDKQNLQDRQQKILDLVGEFCAKQLDEEYSELTERLIKLGLKEIHRLRQANHKYGLPQSYTRLGQLIFYLTSHLNRMFLLTTSTHFFGTSKSTTGNKSKQIRDLLKLDLWDNEFSTKRMRNSNPYANLVMVDGLIVPVNTLPEQFQQAVRQARAEGKDISFTTR